MLPASHDCQCTAPTPAAFVSSQPQQALLADAPSRHHPLRRTSLCFFCFFSALLK